MDIPTAVTNREIEEMVQLARDKTVLEIGSLLGYSTHILARAARVVHAVDPHRGYPSHDPKPTLAPFMENLETAGVLDQVIVHVGYDYDVLPILRRGSFDLVFIDITGEFDDTYRCMVRAAPLLTHSGVLCVHDCGHPDWPGALQAVGKFSLERHRGYRLVDRLAIFDQQTWGE